MWSTRPNLSLLSSLQTSSIISRRWGRPSLLASAGWTARSWQQPRRSLSSWRGTALCAVLTAPGLHLFIWWRRRTAAGGLVAIFGDSTLLLSRILTRCRTCSTSPTSPQLRLSSSGWAQTVEEFFSIRTGTLERRTRHEEHCLVSRFNPHSLRIKKNN